MQPNDSEIIIKKGRANHLKQYEGVGGKLFLTNQRLFFKSHFVNVQTHEESIQLKDIVGVEAKHSDFISRRLSIFLSNGTVEHFIVYKRGTWVEEIQKAIKESKQQSEGSWHTKKPIATEIPSKRVAWSMREIIHYILIGIFVGLLLFLLL